VTWLFEGWVRHLDSRGHDQMIEPGQLNLMTAGRGIAHAEISPDPRPARLHGVQLWLALPEGRRDTEPGFAHHGELPVLDLGAASATVLVGELAGRSSPAVVHSPLLGAEVAVSSSAPFELPLEADFEHAVLVVDGSVVVDGRDLGVGDCRYLGRLRRRLSLSGSPSGRLLLLGGEPYGGPLFMWWNFVGGSGDEIVAAREDWAAGRRFGSVRTEVGRVPAPPLAASRLRAPGSGWLDAQAGEVARHHGSAGGQR
jgi:redox-sensitive bicupin YhaK (pirin superfamily)